MNTVPVVVLEVPAPYRADVEDLSRLFDDHSHPSTVRGFGGELVVQIIVPVTAAAYRLLRAWILAKTERAKNTKITWNGNEISGVTGEDLTRILDHLYDQLPPSDLP